MNRVSLPKQNQKEVNAQICRQKPVTDANHKYLLSTHYVQDSDYVNTSGADKCHGFYASLPNHIHRQLCAWNSTSHRLAQVTFILTESRYEPDV